MGLSPANPHRVIRLVFYTCPTKNVPTLSRISVLISPTLTRLFAHRVPWLLPAGSHALSYSPHIHHSVSRGQALSTSVGPPSLG